MTTRTTPSTAVTPPGGATLLRTAAATPAVRGWVLAATVYFLAVFHRSSLGVAGLLAEHRFYITSAELGTFVLLQIGVYAAMQVPTGVLVDRYGPRRLLVAAAVLMGIGQLLFALAPSFGMALVARGLLGCGDAMTFVSVLRFAAVRFSRRRYPLLVALTATIGTLGNVLATLPLELLLDHAGWAPSFGVAAVLSLVTAVLVWLFLDDPTTPTNRMHGVDDLRVGIVSVSRRVAAAWALPGTRLGFWVHFAAMCTATTLSVLWGHPYLVDGVGLSSASASVVLLVAVVMAGLAGPVVGWFISRHARLRVGMVLTTCAVSVVGWTVVALALGDHPPTWFVVPLFVITLIGGPASMAAFAIARDYNPARIIGTATGVVNVGGFVATAVSAVGFGLVLSVLGGTSPAHLRYAVLVPVVVQLCGSLRVVAWVRRLRAELVVSQRAGLAVPVRVSRHHVWDADWHTPDDESLGASSR